MKLIAVLLTMAFSFSAAATDMDEIHSCLRNWGKTPFSKDNPDFRVITSKVRVMGVGDNVEDTRPTEKPELVLLKPAVSVMSKSVMKLMNPNGWYCIKGKVDVMGKSEIELHCKAHMASSKESATVMGSNKTETGVTVMGSTTVNRVCDGTSTPETDAPKKPGKASKEKEDDSKAE
jgi:hypothetical protein